MEWQRGIGCLIFIGLFPYNHLLFCGGKIANYGILCIFATLYGVAMISRLLKIICLFCRISSLLQGSFVKETYNFEEPTNRCHPISHVCRSTVLHTLSLSHTHTLSLPPSLPLSFSPSHTHTFIYICIYICVYTNIYTYVCTCHESRQHSIQHPHSTTRSEFPCDCGYSVTHAPSLSHTLSL